MAKFINNINLFVKGDPAQPAPTIAYMTYDVVSGEAKKTNNVHQFADPDFTKTGKELWAEGVAAIEIAEGISASKSAKGKKKGGK